MNIVQAIFTDWPKRFRAWADRMTYSKQTREDIAHIDEPIDSPYWKERNKQ